MPNPPGKDSSPPLEKLAALKSARREEEANFQGEAIG